ncbi:MAG: hypothetical protein ACRDZM_04790 [Acidimicrobiia bacterium]
MTALILAATMFVACTPGADGPSATAAPQSTTTIAATTTTTLGSSDAVEVFRACLLDRGVEIEEVPIDATGRPRLDMVLVALDLEDPVIAEAVSRCSEYLETGALDLGGEDVLRQEILGQLTDFSRCMVDLGVEDFPDPLPGFLGVGSPFPVAQIPYSDPDFTAAVAVCRADLLEALSDAEGDS